ncbi:Vacuolar ATPase assembly integral membrane protein VMA21 [Venustampulla echinocandica]|uniref:Vacuolar ATPase assembly integral membrane protein VMA21 n=1 Tax=Venustampulla echinocandica TaxID=2656787 RepID=A0A370THJ9_9HELO|nr:Vacuolar ATPase assembly integral membrane protein VMA21 [Venustampulla echinocandica]RDL34675.1 Vacuolar ATPase assembly integral membrane protein VMA21 [Venustampulla echinocandica]
MAARKNLQSDMSFSKEDDSRPMEKSNITPVVPAHVIYNLLGFTLAMVVCPIGSYFLTLNTIFGGNSTYAGATAAIMANVVLMGYVIVAFREDKSDALEAAEKERERKGQ